MLGQLLTFGCRPQLPYSATHMCVCSQQQFGLPKLLNVQHPQLTPSLTFAATHMCVLTAAIGRDPQAVYPETHMCMPTAASGRPTLGLVCAHSSNWSAKPQVTYDQNFHLALFCFILHQRCVCSQQLLVMCMPAAAIGRPALDPWGQPSIALFCNTHVCVCSQQQFGLPKLLNVQNPQLTPSLTFSATHMCSRISNGSAKPQLASSATHMCVCAHSSNWFAKVIENPQLTSSSFYSAAHKCVCSQQQLVGQPSARVRNILAGRRVQRVKTHVCADSSNWSANP